MKKLLGRALSCVLALLVTAALAGCNSNDDDSGNSLSGTAATGAPIIGMVVVTDATGAESDPVVIDLDGRFRVKLGKLQAPFLLTATEVGSGKVYYSFARRANLTVNITELTSLALAIAGNGDPADLLANWGSGAESSLDETEILQAAKIIYANLIAQFSAQGIDPQDFNFFNYDFDADSTGLDALLDLIVITFDFGLPIDGGAFDISYDENPLTFDLDIDLSGIDFGDQPDDSGGGGSGGGDVVCPSGTSSLPAVINKKAYNTLYSGTSGTYNNGANVVLTFCGDGSMYAAGTLVNSSYTSNSVSEAVQLYTWTHSGNNLKYEVVIFNGDFYEVNLNKANDNTFIGQFTPL